MNPRRELEGRAQALELDLSRHVPLLSEAS
jgi:hypothetical protein